MGKGLNQWEQYAYNNAISRGWTEAQAIAAAAIVRSEGSNPNGYNPDDNGGISAGILQFHAGGQLNNYARAIGGVSLSEAAQHAIDNPGTAITWALNNYLGAAIKEGASKGLTGSDLAYYAAQFGQVTSYPDRAATAFNEILSSGGNLLTGAVSTVTGSKPVTSGNMFDSIGSYLEAAKGAVIALGNIPGGIAKPFLEFFNRLRETGGYLAQPNFILRVLMVFVGLILFVLGLILFGISLLPESVTDTAKVAIKAAAA